MPTDDDFPLLDTMGCESELAPPEVRTRSKFQLLHNNKSVRTRPMHVQAWWEPLLKASQSISYRLCGLTRTRSAQLSCCRSGPRSASNTPADATAVRQRVGDMRGLKANQHQLLHVKDLRYSRRHEWYAGNCPQPLTKTFVRDSMPAACAMPLSLEHERITEQRMSPKVLEPLAWPWCKVVSGCGPPKNQPPKWSSQHPLGPRGAALPTQRRHPPIRSPRRLCTCAKPVHVVSPGQAHATL